MPDIRKFTGNKKPVTNKTRIACSCGCQVFYLTTTSFICNVCHDEGPLSMILEAHEKAQKPETPSPSAA